MILAILTQIDNMYNINFIIPVLYYSCGVSKFSLVKRHSKNCFRNAYHSLIIKYLPQPFCLPLYLLVILSFTLNFLTLYTSFFMIAHYIGYIYHHYFLFGLYNI